MSNNFRDMLPAPDYPTVAGISDRDAVSHGDRMLASPRGKAFIGSWMARLDAPFVGVTCDGCRREGLFALAPNGAPAPAMVEAARKVLNAATGDERAALQFPIDARNWRMWSNPELYVNRYGVRLDEIGAPLRDAILAVLAASLSERGFHKARACMLMNGFLGQLVGGEKVLNEFSYNFSLFGEPSLDAPWG